MIFGRFPGDVGHCSNVYGDQSTDGSQFDRFQLVVQNSDFEFRIDVAF